jgi:formylglycine-generating enzyme required for sulfatase activity
LWTLKVYNTGKTGEAGYKTVRDYYGTTKKGGTRNDEEYCNYYGYELCGTSNSSNDFGYLRVFNDIVVPKELTGGGTIPDDDVAVCNVSWYGGLAYSQWLGGSLPTEAQLEFALRRKSSAPFQTPSSAGTAIADQSVSLYNEAYAYAGYVSGGVSGSVVPDYAWYSGNSNDATTASAYGLDAFHNHKVGEKKPNGLGLYDMNGNVWEWCADFYPGRTTYALSDYAGNDGISGSVVVNPVNTAAFGSQSPPYRIVRGGRWGGPASYLRAGYRGGNYGAATSSSGNVGFRPAFLLPFAL